MFDFIRKHTKVTMALLFLLIVPSFILVGMDGASRSSDKGVAVATVDGKDIMQSEWDRAHQVEVDRLRAQMPTIDIKLLDSPEARYGTLEKLVRDRVTAAAADKFKLASSDQRLARELQQSPRLPRCDAPMVRWTWSAIASCLAVKISARRCLKLTYAPTFPGARC